MPELDVIVMKTNQLADVAAILQDAIAEAERKYAYNVSIAELQVAWFTALTASFSKEMHGVLQEQLGT